MPSASTSPVSSSEITVFSAPSQARPHDNVSANILPLSSSTASRPFITLPSPTAIASSEGLPPHTVVVDAATFHSSHDAMVWVPSEPVAEGYLIQLHIHPPTSQQVYVAIAMSAGTGTLMLVMLAWLATVHWRSWRGRLHLRRTCHPFRSVVPSRPSEHLHIVSSKLSRNSRSPANALRVNDFEAQIDVPSDRHTESQSSTSVFGGHITDIDTDPPPSYASQPSFPMELTSSQETVVSMRTSSLRITIPPLASSPLRASFSSPARLYSATSYYPQSDGAPPAYGYH
ncbi:hypothetical protein EIP91_002751 [Steccherinum ochraceum]|uniref:Uncharacterized protein n=1 Tax=Steccherinum ochraceum TaxID=92696 RepID=A0A4V2MW93_9APHY|nr:hypothetical protein EIP91_002751 [Steccherinum ochraceum]